MSAPYIIPFNFQPSSTATYGTFGGTAASYTIPAGKYARIGLKNTVSVDIGGGLYIVSKNAIIAARTLSATTATFILDGSENVVSVDIVTNNTNQCYITFGGYGESSVTASATSYHINKTTLTTVSKAFPSPRNIFWVAGLSASSTVINSLYLNIYNPPDFLWVKSGDTINFTGNLTIELYNQIS